MNVRKSLAMLGLLAGLLPVLGLAAQVVEDAPADDIGDDVGTPAVENHESTVSASTLLEYANPKTLSLHSSNALIVDQREGVHLFAKNIDEKRPIASLTKLMTAMVVIDADLPMDEEITISDDDRDRLRSSRSRLKTGMVFTRRDLLLIALAASENRASKALARTYPGGTKEFVGLMNAKARALGMSRTHFDDASGLMASNVSTPRDLVLMTSAATNYPLIHQFTTEQTGQILDLHRNRYVKFLNTNRLVRGDSWDIGLSKTGYITDAGHCLVMQAEIGDRSVIMVFLNSWGKLSKFGDSNRVRNWLIKAEHRARQLSSLAQSGS